MCGNWQTCTNSWLSKVVLKLCLLLISNHHHPPCLSLRAHAVCAPSLLQRVGTLIACSLNIPSGLYFFYNSFSLGDHVDHWDVWVLVMSTSFPLSLGIMWIIGMCECLSWVLPSLKMQEVDVGSVGVFLASLGRDLPNLPASKVSQRWTMWVRWVVRGHINGTLP